VSIDAKVDAYGYYRGQTPAAGFPGSDPGRPFTYLWQLDGRGLTPAPR